MVEWYFFIKISWGNTLNYNSEKANNLTDLNCKKAKNKASGNRKLCLKICRNIRLFSKKHLAGFWLMKIVLQNKITKKFFTKESVWHADINSARQFQTQTDALNFGNDLDLPQTQVLVLTETGQTVVSCRG